MNPNISQWLKRILALLALLTYLFVNDNLGVFFLFALVIWFTFDESKTERHTHGYVMPEQMKRALSNMQEVIISGILASARSIDADTVRLAVEKTFRQVFSTEME